MAKIMRRTGGRSTSGVTINDIDASQTPSLVGYWKCNESSGLTVKDYSGNGFDLTIVPSIDFGPRDESFWWGTNPGYLTLEHGDKALRTGMLNSLLDTKAKFVIASYELIQQNVYSDSDMGQACIVENPFPDESASSDYLGFTLSAGGVGVQAFRVAIDKAVYDDLGAFPTSRITAADNTVPPGASGPDGNSGVFRPDVPNISFSRNGESLITVAVDASVTELKMTQADGGTFGFGTSHAASQDFHHWTAIRNYQVWAFDAEPDNLDLTLQWLSANPNNIPKWWIGR